jgi:signal transduction histidine kinase
VHPPLPDENGLSQAIQWYRQGLMERGAVEIELDIHEDFGGSPPTLNWRYFAIPREHSSPFWQQDRDDPSILHFHDVLLEIQDHGKGSVEMLTAIKAQPNGLGITGMRERALHFMGETG